MNPVVTEFFWKHIAAGPNNCWIWTGVVSGQGKRGADHGRLSAGGEKHYAHRFSWELHSGKIPKGMFVLHRCDVPRCVNPDHLYLGDQRDNVQDRVSRGRSAPMPSRRKLTCEQAQEIRARAARGESHTSISKDYPVTRATVGNVVNNKHYVGPLT